MSTIDIEDLKKEPTPFFTKYLEGQEPVPLSEEEMKKIKGGRYLTYKYPSDHEGIRRRLVTYKYPSDQERWRRRR